MRRTVVRMLIAVMPALVPAASVSAQAAPDRRPLRTSWVADGSKLGVGDIVTILVDEYVLASADVARVDARQKDSNQAVSAGSGGASGFGLRTVNDASDRRRGENTRRDAFTAEMTARVVEVAPNGMMRIEGKKTLKLDDHEQELVLRGWVRPRDVTASNTIDSWRMADAEVLYSSNGVLGEPERGIFAKILGIIF